MKRILQLQSARSGNLKHSIIFFGNFELIPVFNPPDNTRSIETWERKLY
jgi:hypothetical protein